MPAPMTPERTATLEAMRFRQARKGIMRYQNVRVGQEVTTPDHGPGVVVAVEENDTLWPVVVEIRGAPRLERVRRYEAHELKG